MFQSYTYLLEQSMSGTGNSAGFCNTLLDSIIIVRPFIKTPHILTPKEAEYLKAPYIKTQQFKFYGKIYKYKIIMMPYY